MGKAISELDSYAGPMSGTTKLPVSDSDTLKTATASQVKTYIEGEIGTAQFRALLDDADAAAQRATLGLGDAATKNVGSAAGTLAAGDHTHSGYAATGAIGSSGLTMATAKLLGRSTASAGAVEEITLGTNLSFSGTTLNAAGGSSGGAGARWIGAGELIPRVTTG